MKISQIAAALAEQKLLAVDAKPEAVTAALNALLAADKKAKDEEEKEMKEKAAADKAAKDKKGKDADPAGPDDPEKTNDEYEDMDVEDEDPCGPESGAPKPGGKDKKGKDKAMDAATVASLIAANDAKHAAARQVESILGVVSYDSADKYYKAALDKLGVDTAGVHASAFPAMLKLAKDKSTAQSSSVFATDSSATAVMAAAIPGYDRLR